MILRASSKVTNLQLSDCLVPASVQQNVRFAPPSAMDGRAQFPVIVKVREEKARGSPPVHPFMKNRIRWRWCDPEGEAGGIRGGYHFPEPLR
jgi:hypothetical protein